MQQATSAQIAYLEKQAKAVRCRIIQMLTEAKSGHPGGSLSCADILTALYFAEMKVDAKNPQMAGRDHFVLSKGHAAPALYTVLALKGFFPAEELMTLRKLGSPLQGHPDMHKVPGVDISTGSLGQGLSAACGMALAARLSGDGSRVYAILGDGENEEGQIWEAAMFAAHYKLDHLVAFLDHNHLQIDGNICDVLSPEPLDEKWRAFGWHVLKINGHHMAEILAALAEARTVTGKPVMIIAETVKGKGVSFMENQAGWHGVAPKPEERDCALAELA